MSMVTKNIILTDQEDSWIQSRFAAGGYRNESEIFSQLIHEQQIREQETPEDIATIRAALIEGEESIKRDGYCKQSVREIWEEAKSKYLATKKRG